MNYTGAKSSAFKSVLGFSIPSWINAAMGIITIPLVTRVFEPDVLGKFNLFNTYGAILQGISLVGLNQGLVRFYHEPTGRNTAIGLYKSCQGIVALTTVIIASVVLVFSNELSQAICGEVNSYVSVCLCIVVATVAFLTIKVSLYRIEDSIFAYGVLVVLMSTCAKTSYLGATFLDNKFIGAISLLTVSYILITLPYLVKDFRGYRSQPAVFGAEETLPLLKYSLPLMPTLFVAQINSTLPTLLIGTFLDYSQVAIYTTAHYIVGIMGIAQSGIIIFWPAFVFKNYIKQPKLLSTAYEIITFVMIIFGLIVFLFQDIFYLVIGLAYRESQYFFAMLVFSSVCYAISETTGIGITISKKTYLNSAGYIVSSLVTFVLCYMLIPRLALIGAACAVAAAALAMLITKSWIGHIHYKVVGSPLKLSVALAFFATIVVLNSFVLQLFWLRTGLILFVMLITCLIYQKEMALCLKILGSMSKGIVGSKK